MEKTLSNDQQPIFERIKQTDTNGSEYWGARQFAKALGYREYRNFQPVIQKAKKACTNSAQRIHSHFVELHEMVSIGLGVERQIDNVQLSRYACYLIVQNADPSKAIVALGQTYFALQTRKQELSQMDDYNRLNTEDEKRLFLRNELKKHNTQLADAAKQAGVVKPIDYAIFQSHGYQGLYGGLKMKDIHAKKQLKKSQQILDHMGSTELAANLFRATQTEDKLRRDHIKGKEQANKTHYQVGKKVRKTIQELDGAMPEDLPTVPSIKKIQPTIQKKRKLKNNNKS